MNFSTISLSYIFLGIFVVAILFYAYFKFVLIKSSDKSPDKDKIIGTMKKPEVWHERNKRMSYIALFWSVISLAVFVFLKYLYKSPIIPSFMIFIYLGVIVLSSVLFLPRKTRSK
ncbi:hypothetical protein SDC9_113315 [bioreactor metagenome]|uniref:Uncharacterized protein n=1 Tax=bioreactor metagenome TaxID=1076179 RepID=A0A645BMQ9_9ZZZZ|nr:hypothetical protein [Clostridium sp. HMP27]KGK87547.1 hypothetical protein DP68_09615 [Clostridium sp. HMP27]